ncbi:hypothetical protein ACFLYR_03150 [Chloroflexota bacterium]
MQKLKGPAMTTLVEGSRLKRADILLAHTKGNFWGWLIRCGTRCYWNHAFIIYMVKDPAQDYDKALIIDPKMGSIHMDNIAHYFENPDQYDVAVRRLEAEWFQKDSEAGGRPYCQTVCDIALRETAEKFDTRLVRYLRRTLRQVRLIYRFARRRIKYRRPSKMRSTPITQRLKIRAYSCGGFVQWSYYQGVSRILNPSQDESKLQEVIFNPKLVGEVSDYELLSTTPADLARSAKLSWKYVVKDGVVWKVSSEEEVSSIISQRRGKITAVAD